MTGAKEATADSVVEPPQSLPTEKQLLCLPDTRSTKKHGATWGRLLHHLGREGAQVGKPTATPG